MHTDQLCTLLTPRTATLARMALNPSRMIGSLLCRGCNVQWENPSMDALQWAPYGGRSRLTELIVPHCEQSLIPVLLDEIGCVVPILSYTYTGKRP